MHPAAKTTSGVAKGARRQNELIRNGKWSRGIESPTATESDRIISRDDFLAGRLLSMQDPRWQLPGSYRLHTESCAVVTPLLKPSPPPGLELPEHLEPLEPLPIEEPKEYKVLLQSLPEAMLKECMFRAALEQAGLKDVTKAVIRTDGKALVTFAAYESVCKCIKHFHGRQWGGSPTPVTALYVTTAKRAETVAGNNNLQQQEAAAKSMSGNAHVFVRGSAQLTSKTLSADAPTFVPASCSDKIVRDRFFSDASTEAGPASDEASDGCDSETEVQAVCT